MVAEKKLVIPKNQRNLQIGDVYRVDGVYYYYSLGYKYETDDNDKVTAEEVLNKIIQEVTIFLNFLLFVFLFHLLHLFYDEHFFY